MFSRSLKQANDATCRRHFPKWTVVMLCIYFLAAVFAEFACLNGKWNNRVPGYNQVNLDLRYRPPLTRAVARDGSEHFFLLGSDNLGRDVFRRLLQGSRIAFHVGVISSLIAVPFGALLGLAAGYFRGKIDAICTGLAATVAAVPSVLLILAISLIAGKGLFGVYLGIGCTTWVGVYRTIRSETLKHANRGYVLSAKVLGYSTPRILFRHILPNVMHLVIIQFSLRFPAAVSTEVFLSFLGLGAQDEPSWGVMLNNARIRLWQGIWWEGFFVTLAVFGLILCANRFGDALRDRLDPSLR